MEEVESMARRRYLSTRISLDKIVNRIATTCGDFAALFYTWGIPHAEEDATLSGDPEELLGTIVPLRRDKTPEDIEETMSVLADAGLILWNRPMNLMQYPIEAFYEYQSNITTEKRRSENISNDYQSTADNCEEQQETARKRVSSSLSISSSVSSTRNRVNKPDLTEEFEEWWSRYPHPPIDDKPRARKNYATTRSKVDKETLWRATDIYSSTRKGEDRQFNIRAANFVGRDKRYEAYLEPIAVDKVDFAPVTVEDDVSRRLREMGV